MIVGLYTSRVVLATLGVEDYGVYNVVGGLVSMFGLLSGSMSAATNRYVAFELGRGENTIENLRKVFNLSIQIYLLLSVITILLVETVGLWFLFNKMTIPEGRMQAAFWVLQISVLTMVLSVMIIPYSAEIVAHERMTAFAYISVVEAVLKLAIVFVLRLSSFDKLIFYAVLLALVQMLIQLCYMLYCHKMFPEIKYRRVKDWKLFKEMTSFAGWNMFGSLASISCNQGLTMLLNVFFGPVANAARAVATQVQCGVTMFITNFQTALNPQIVKSYAQKNFGVMHQLMYRSSKFSFFLMFMLGLPVLIEAPIVLHVWLKTVPVDTVVFLRLIICISLIYTIANPILTANNATGDVRIYYIVCGSLMILILPLSYCALKMGLPAYSVFVVHFFIEAVTQIVRLFMVRKRLQLSIRSCVKEVYIPIAIVVLTSSILPCCLCWQLKDSLFRLVLVCVISVFSVATCSLFFGFSCSERQFVFRWIRGIISNGKYSR